MTHSLRFSLLALFLSVLVFFLPDLKSNSKRVLSDNTYIRALLSRADNIGKEHTPYSSKPPSTSGLARRAPVNPPPDAVPLYQQHRRPSYHPPPLPIPPPPRTSPRFLGPFDPGADPPPPGQHSPKWLEYWRKGREYWNYLEANTSQRRITDEPCVDLRPNWFTISRRGSEVVRSPEYIFPRSSLPEHQLGLYDLLWVLDGLAATTEDGIPAQGLRQVKVRTDKIYNRISLSSQTGLDQDLVPFTYAGYIGLPSGTIINNNNEGWVMKTLNSRWDQLSYKPPIPEGLPKHAYRVAADGTNVVRAPNSWAEASYSLWQSLCRQSPEGFETSSLKFNVQEQVNEPVTKLILQEIRNNEIPVVAWDLKGQVLPRVPDEGGSAQTQGRQSWNQQMRQQGYFKLWQFFPTDQNGHFFTIIGSPAGADSFDLLWRFPKGFATSGGPGELKKVKTLSRILMVEGVQSSWAQAFDLGFVYNDIKYERRIDVDDEPTTPLPEELSPLPGLPVPLPGQPFPSPSALDENLPSPLRPADAPEQSDE